MKEIRYYAVVGASDGRAQEVLVTRRNGRQISQEPTGTMYEDFNAAGPILAHKNATSWKIQQSK